MCFCRGFSILSFLLLVNPAMGYAEKFDLIEARKVSANKEDGNADIVVDAMKVQQLYIMGDTVGGKVRELAIKGGPKVYEDIQGAFCKSSKVNPKIKITALLPKPPAGIPLDVSTKKTKEYVEMIRRYLREMFFYDLTTLDLGDNESPTSPDYDLYKKFVVDTKGEKKYGNRFMVQVPLATSRKQDQVLKLYERLTYQPDLASMRWDVISQSIEHAANHFMILYTSDGEALLLPKIAPTYQKQFGDGVDSKGRLGSVSGNSLETSDSLQAFYKRTHFFVSEIGWKLPEVEDGPVYPIQLAVASDLQFMLRNYTFIIPAEDATKIFGDLDEKDMWQYVGYKGGEKRSFSPDLSIRNRDFMWQGVLASATTVMQSDQKDKMVFTLKLNMTSVCAAGLVPISGLQSQ